MYRAIRPYMQNHTSIHAVCLQITISRLELRSKGIISTKKYVTLRLNKKEKKEKKKHSSLLFRHPHIN